MNALHFVTTVAGSRLGRCFGLAALGLTVLAGKASAQTIYTWNVTGSANWSATADWAPAAGTGGPGSLDTATFSSATAATTVTYDGSAPGTIGTLDMSQTANSVATILQLGQNLTISTGANLLSTNNLSTAAQVNSEQINLGNFSLTIGSGATMLLGSTSASVNLATNNVPVYVTTSGSGKLLVNGTLEAAYGYTTPSGAFQASINAPVVLGAAGVLQVDTETGATASSARLVISGDFDAGAGGTLEATGTASTKGMIFFNGTNVTIGAGTTVTGFLQGGNIGAAGGIIFGGTNATQNISLGQAFDFGFRSGAAGTASVQNVYVKKLSSTATSGGVSNAVGEITLYVSNNDATIDLQLASNLNATKLQTSSPFSYLYGTGSVATVDLNGYVFDQTTASATSTFQPYSGATVGASEFTLANSGASSISGGQGIYRAGSFTFEFSDDGVGSGVILQATNPGGTSDLGVVSGGITTVSAGSTFYYSGVGSANLQSTNNRSIGGIVVGTGSSSSTLKLTSAITAGGNAQVNAGAALDLNAKALSLGAGKLTGAGTVQSATAGGTVSFTTGGLAPGGGTATAHLTLGSGVAANLGVAGTTLSTSLFDLASAFDYDQILGSGAVNLNDATLVVNLLSGFSISSPTGFTLFSGTTTLTGAFTDAAGVTLTGSNAASYSATFANGVLTVSAVPEPGALGMMAAALLLLGGAAWARRGCAVGTATA